MAKRAFIYGTMVLFAASLFNRILAFVYQYFIMTWVGSEAYGLYQMVFPTYMMALVVTTAGLPLAVSKMVSEQVALGNLATARKIFRLALAMLLLSGLLISVLLFTLIPYLAGPLFPDPRVFPVFVVCIPAIFIVAASSAFRGYFQGLQEMMPTALAQVCEQITRVSVGVWLSLKLLPLGIEYGAVGLALGMVSGEAVGFFTILALYRRHKNQQKLAQSSKTPGIWSIAKRLFALGLPITAGRFVASGAQTVDSILIPLRLQAAGYSLREATSLYGQLGGAAFTLLTFPTVFTFSLATSLVPAISEALAQKRQVTIQYRTSEAIRVTILIGTPFLIFLYFFGSQLCEIFKSPNAGRALSALAVAGVFFYLQSTTAGILQGLGHPQIPVMHSVVASLLKLICIYYLTAIPSLGLVGTAWAYNLAFFLTSSLNLMAIAQKVGLSFNLDRLILQPLTAATLAAGVIYFTKDTLNFGTANAQMFLEFCLGTGVYLTTLFVNKGLGKQDIMRLPFIGKFIPF